MAPDWSEQGEIMTPPKRLRWYRLLVPFLSAEPRHHMPDAATEAAQIEAAFFASYMDKRPG